MPAASGTPVVAQAAPRLADVAAAARPTGLIGRGTATDRWHTFAGGYADSCRYEITVPDVSAASQRYTVVVGTEPGDAVGFDRDQLLTASIDVPYGHA